MIIKKSRLVPKHTHWMSRLTFLSGLLIAGNSFAQDMSLCRSDVNIFESPEQVLKYLVLVITSDQRKLKNIISTTLMIY